MTGKQLDTVAANTGTVIIPEIIWDNLDALPDGCEYDLLKAVEEYIALGGKQRHASVAKLADAQPLEGCT
jgi:hypothetical protein